MLMFKKIFLIIFIYFLKPINSYAQGYQPLVTNTPIASAAGNSDINAFLTTIFNWGIGIAVSLSILVIILGGIEYMTTDAISKKEDGRNRIKAAVVGLLIALSSWLILNQINPDILKKKNLGLSSVDLSPGAPVGVGGNGVGNTPGNQPGTPSGGGSSYTPGNADFSNLAEYQKNNNYTGTDGSGRTGSISPEIAWMRDSIPKEFGNLKSVSTYRSPQQNSAVGGSSSSAHLRGEAIDFSAKNQSNQAAFTQDGRNLVDYMLKNGSSLGVRQIIFEDKNYKWNGSGWDQGSPVGGHYDHVHIGR